MHLYLRVCKSVSMFVVVVCESVYVCCRFPSLYLCGLVLFLCKCVCCVCLRLCLWNCDCVVCAFDSNSVSLCILVCPQI